MSKTKELHEQICEPLKVYGFEKTADCAVEELAELIQAIQKYKRGYNTAAPKKQAKLIRNFIEELVDVEIMLTQLDDYFYGKFNEKDLSYDKAKQQVFGEKVKRSQKRLKKDTLYSGEKEQNNGR
jgi:NTP pyrophosphatase (non-canonical NTP hydrolase)